jgi:hypothetical protein
MADGAPKEKGKGIIPVVTHDSESMPDVFENHAQ